MAADRPALTAEERDALASADGWRQATRDQHFCLTNRLVADLDIVGIDMENADFVDVVFRNVRFRDTRFRRTRFADVTFDWCGLTNTGFHGCEMTKWVFTDSEAKHLELRDCSVRGWSSQGCTFACCVWQDVQIHGFVDHMGLFEDATWTNVVIDQPHWRRTLLRRPRLNRVTLVQGSLIGVSMVNGEAQGLALREIDLDGLEIMLGSYQGLAFEQMTGVGLRLAELQCQGIGLVGSGRLTGVSATGIDCTGMVVHGNLDLSLFGIGYSNIRDLLIAESRICGLAIRDTRVSGESLVQSSWLDGVDFESSQVDGLAVENATMTTVLRVPGAHFRRLRLAAVTYQAPFEIEGHSVTYQEGDAFQR